MEKARTFQNPAQPTELEQEHVPIITIGKPTQKGEQEVKIEIFHPMKDDHHIEWLRLEKNKEKIGEVRFSELDQKAEALFSVKLEEGDRLRCTDSCNLHGIWYNQLKV